MIPSKHDVYLEYEEEPWIIISGILIYANKESNPGFFYALWDTGATTSSISKEVIAALNLTPDGQMGIRSSNSESIQDTYTVGVAFWDSLVAITDVQVNDAVPRSERFQVVIGMDIIKQGNLFYGKVDDKYLFTFDIR